MRRTRRLQFAVGLLLGSVLAVWSSRAAEAPTRASYYRIRPGDSTVRFTISKWIVFKEEGRFRDFGGTVYYDPANPGNSWVQFEVGVRSIETGLRGRDRTLLEEDFFHAQRYPTMTFRSLRVVPGENRTLSVTGNLTIRGVTKPITAQVELLGFRRMRDGGEIAGFETTFTIDRRDFGVLGSRWSEGRMILGSEVTVHLIISAEKTLSTSLLPLSPAVAARR